MLSSSGSKDKEDVVHKYSGILLSQKNEMLAFATTWVDHEGITLHESLNF